jgi:hypothetical protein
MFVLNVPIENTAADMVELNNGIIRVEVPRSGVPYEEIYFKGPSGVEHRVFDDRLRTEIRGGMFYIYDDIPIEYEGKNHFYRR